MNNEIQIRNELEQLQKQLSQESDQIQRLKLLREVEQKEGQLNRLQRQQKKLQKQNERKQKNKLLESFSSGRIKWIKENRLTFYPTWNGYFNNKLLFKLEQKLSGFNLTLTERNQISSSFEDIQKRAETILESFAKLATLSEQELKTIKKKDAPPIETPQELKLSKYFQSKLQDIPEEGMGYQNVHLVLFDDTIIHNVMVTNGENLKLPFGTKININDIKDII